LEINLTIMNPRPTPEFPFCASSPSGIRVELNSNSSIRRMDCGDVMLNVFLGNEVEGGPANIYLRRLGDVIESTPLLGPGAPATFETCGRGMVSAGTWENIAFRIRLVLSESAKAWFWHVELENTGAGPLSCDLILTQDLALAHYGAVRLNEYYVSQYIDHAPLHHPQVGVAVASRQNQAMGGNFPWTVIGSLGRAISYSTDALQFHGLDARVGAAPVALGSGLADKRLQHEHSLVAIQEEPILLEVGARSQRGFFGWFEADHAAATTEADLRWIDGALALAEAACPSWPAEVSAGVPARSWFGEAPFLVSQDLDEVAVDHFFGGSRRHVEHDGGQVKSFFTGTDSHVVMRNKELDVLRPHGHLLRSGGSLTADEAALTSTAWMGGVFHSMVTQGHVSINRFLSTCHSYLGLFRSHGQRVFMEVDGAWSLLGIPSAFEMRPAACRWIYQHAGGVIEVRSSAPDDSHVLRLELKVLKGDATRFLISHHVAINGDDGSSPVPVIYQMDGNTAVVRAVPESDVGRRFPEGTFSITPDLDTPVESVGGDELLFSDGLSRRQPFLCFITAATCAVGLSIRGQLVEPATVGMDDFWKSIRGGLEIAAPESSIHAPAAERAAEIFPWFIHNALVHYLSPRGLEQYSGGGWGTRDVCQGPVELLLALGRFGPIRDLLCRVFRQQNTDGDWPQWFMFFERERNIRPGDSHGDIVYWPVLALAQYLTASGDASILDESLPFFHPDGDAAAERVTILQHVERALELIENRVIQGTVLAAYGHGDWNDSLQPAKPDMRERLCSSWTVTLNYQTFKALAAALRQTGMLDRAERLDAMASRILEEFQRVLIVDQVVAGLAYFHENGKTDLLLHPQDGSTGLSFSLLPMIHGIINDMFTPEQAAAHLELIRTHLLGPDGAHLFDRPMEYRGGIQTNFQRAESASYFGREIGIMYMHAHLRYCEALAHFGDVEGFFRSLGQINPIAIRDLVPSAGLRQANCYYSSSDALFADRYEAFEHYDQVNEGTVALEGGWRVYSSGAGIGTRLIMQCFLGIRLEAATLILDPVVPPSLNGMKVTLRIGGALVEVVYHIGATGCGVRSAEINGRSLEFTREPNPYRLGAIRISLKSVTDAISGGPNQLSVVVD
jgi:cellobiose phosphorylase